MGLSSPWLCYLQSAFLDSRACLTQHLHAWQNPALDGSTAKALMAVATAGCGVAMAFCIFTMAFCIFVRWDVPPGGLARLGEM